MIIIIPIWKITTVPLISVPGQEMASEYFGLHEAKDNSTKKPQFSASKIIEKKNNKAEMVKIIHKIVCRDCFIKT